MVSPSSNELTQDGETIRVESKVMALLVALSERPGETVSRDDLLNEVWPDVVVNPDTLSRSVSKLRHALGDDAQAPQYVETIPKRGYRLLVRPQALAVPPPVIAEPLSAPPISSPSHRTLAWVGIGVGIVIVVGLMWALLHNRQVPLPAYSTEPLTTAPGIERDPAIGSSGQIVYASLYRDSTSYDLFIRTPSATQAQRLTSGPAHDRHPVFSPDGQEVAFLRCEAPFVCQIYTTPVVGGTPQRLTDKSVAPYGLTWSPDGTTLAFVERDSVTAPYRVTLLNRAARTRTRITEPPAESVGDLLPRFTPDGQSLLFIRHTQDATEDLFMVDLGTQRAEPITTLHTRIVGYSWTANQDALLLSTRSGHTPALWQVAMPSREARQLVLPRQDLGNLTASGNRTIAEVWSLETNIWSLDTEQGQEPQPAIQSTAVDHQPALSPDGQRIAFVSTRSGNSELWRASRDGSQALRLTELDGQIGAPHWSPDGQTIVFEYQSSEQADLYRIHADGGGATALTLDSAYDLAPRWTPGGRWILFGSDRDGGWNIWKITAQGDSLQQVTTDGGFAAAQAEDGTVFFMRYLEDGLWHIPPGSTTPVRFLEQPAALDWGNWALTTTGLVFLERGPAEDRLVHYDRTTEVLAELGYVEAVPTREPGISVTPDGRFIIYAQQERVESDLVWLTAQ